MTGEKNRRSLFTLANAVYVESLGNNTNKLEAKCVPSKIATSIVSKLLDNYHERLNDEGDAEQTAKRSLTQLDGLRLEHFSTDKYVQLNQQLIMGTITNDSNHFRSLDLTNVRVADVEDKFRHITLDGDDGRYDVPAPPNSVLEIIMDESEYDSDNADMDIDSVTTAAEPKIEKKSKIKSDWIESLALPRLVSDERESLARVKATNQFVNEHFNLGSSTPQNMVYLTKSALPNLTQLSIGSATCLRFGTVPPTLTTLNLSHINRKNYSREQISLAQFPLSVLSPTLKSLILHESEFNNDFLNGQIYACDELEFLDISRTPPSQSHSHQSIVNRPFERPSCDDSFELGDIIQKLPHLHSIDLSGTESGMRLKSNKLITCSGESGRLRIDLPDFYGLSLLSPSSLTEQPKTLPSWLSRLPLNYLGLWGCDIQFERMELLAKNIAGGRDARQMLVSAKRWRNEPAMAAQIWNAIFDFLRNNADTSVFLEECILTFNKYYHDETFKLPLILSANMFYLVNPVDQNDSKMDCVLKQESLRCLIRCINFNIDTVRVIRNCLLTMSKFQLPDDLLFIYETSAQTMLKVLSKYHVPPSETRPEDAQFLTNMVIQFANQFVCQVDLNLKLATRRIKFIDTICTVIEKRLDDPTREDADDPLKGCWSCLWNVTDETPSNSERFIEQGGVKLFLRCLDKYPNDTDLKRNIMGLVGNIAEVEYLRSHLIREDTIKFYCDALVSDATDGLEVAYNACGTLSHILSDQNHVWPESLLDKKAEITTKMIKAIEKWDEAAERNINYRSLKPIIHLIRCHHCVEAQTWATWALASLTHREQKSGKYIGLTIEEGGYEALQDLIERNKASTFILDKAKTVLGRVQPRFLEIQQNTNNLNS